MLKIKKNDTVQVIKGKDKGKKGRVLAVYAGENRVLVEGLNTVKKHKRQTRQEEKGGILTIEKPIQMANIALVCKHCQKAVRVGFTVLSDGTKTRTCKSCKEAI